MIAHANNACRSVTRNSATPRRQLQTATPTCVSASYASPADTGYRVTASVYIYAHTITEPPRRGLARVNEELAVTAPPRAKNGQNSGNRYRQTVNNGAAG